MNVNQRSVTRNALVTNYNNMSRKIDGDENKTIQLTIDVTDKLIELISSNDARIANATLNITIYLVAFKACRHGIFGWGQKAVAEQDGCLIMIKSNLEVLNNRHSDSAPLLTYDNMCRLVKSIHGGLFTAVIPDVFVRFLKGLDRSTLLKIALYGSNMNFLLECNIFEFTGNYFFETDIAYNHDIAELKTRGQSSVNGKEIFYVYHDGEHSHEVGLVNFNSCNQSTDVLLGFVNLIEFFCQNYTYKDQIERHEDIYRDQVNRYRIKNEFGDEIGGPYKYMDMARISAISHATWEGHKSGEKRRYQITLYFDKDADEKAINNTLEYLDVFLRQSVFIKDVTCHHVIDDDSRILKEFVSYKNPYCSKDGRVRFSMESQPMEYQRIKKVMDQNPGLKEFMGIEIVDRIEQALNQVEVDSSCELKQFEVNSFKNEDHNVRMSVDDDREVVLCVIAYYDGLKSSIQREWLRSSLVSAMIYNDSVLGRYLGL